MPLAAPAFAESGGKPGYSYAGVVTQKRTAGVQAMITAPVAPQVESGDVSGWIGVGRVGVDGKRGVVCGRTPRRDGRHDAALLRGPRNGGWVRHLGPWSNRASTTSSRSRARARTPSAGASSSTGTWSGPAVRLATTGSGCGPSPRRSPGTAEPPRATNSATPSARSRSGTDEAGAGSTRRRPVQDPGYKVLNQHKARFLATNVSVSAGARAFAGDWETGDASQWSGNHWNRNVPLSDQFEIVCDPVHQGGFAARFTVRPGDKFGETSGERSEVLYTGANEVEGDDVWYAWSTLFPSDWTTPERLVDLRPVALVLSGLAPDLLQHEGRAHPGELQHGRQWTAAPQPSSRSIRSPMPSSAACGTTSSSTSCGRDDGSMEVWHGQAATLRAEGRRSGRLDHADTRRSRLEQLPEDRLLPKRRAEPTNVVYQDGSAGRRRRGARAGLRRRSRLRDASATRSRRRRLV